MKHSSVLLALVALGCTTRFDFETTAAGGAGGTSEVTTASAGGIGGAGAGGEAGAGGGALVLSCRDPAMALVPKPLGGWYCIDATEVTRTAYDPFAGMQSTQAGLCAWNTTFVPDVTGLCAGAWPPGQQGELPVVCVDWCDAYGYCAQAGKRLCETSETGSFADPMLSEWFNACSRAGVLQFPYGDLYNATACNGGDIMPEGLVDVGSFVGCEGGYPGIYDMSGNAWEWIGGPGACTTWTGAADVCFAAGGASYAGQAALRCSTISAPTDFTRATAQHRLGFRCCADAMGP